MTNAYDLVKVLRYVDHIPDKEERFETKRLVLQIIEDSVELKIKKKIVVKERVERQYINFTKTEIKEMPENLQKQYLVNKNFVTYRILEGGYYQARYRREGYNISATSKNFNIMKKLFIEKCCKAEIERKKQSCPKIDAFVLEWLKIKKNIVKNSTYDSYENLAKRNIITKFGNMRVSEITRKDIQDYLFSLVEEGKNRTAVKLKLILSNMFDLIVEDYEIKNPMKKIVLPPYVVKKGQSFSYEEENEIIKYCQENPHYYGNSAILLLMYTGMRFGELASIEVCEDFITCISEKTRKGHAEIKRRIPFSPMLKRVLHLINFEKAKTVSNEVARDALKRVFPERHLHEFRYTFITRAKECGINPEVVMLWTGHVSDKDVKSSRVDLGYTTYSQTYIDSEMMKYDYKL